jgi:hypothetical protein
MANLLANATSVLARILRESASAEVTYFRGNDAVALNASIGRTDHELVDADTGAMQRVVTRDFLFEASRLILAESGTRPLPGDQIHEQVGDETHVYQVLAVDGRNCWTFEGSHNLLLRVHTKLVESYRQ